MRVWYAVKIPAGGDDLVGVDCCAKEQEIVAANLEDLVDGDVLRDLGSTDSGFVPRRCDRCGQVIYGV